MARPFTTPEAPTNLVATAGDGQVTVTFLAPAETGGAPITDYEYALAPEGDLRPNIPASWISAGTTSSPILISGLTNGMRYTLFLRAVNAAGPGLRSDPASFETHSPESVFESVKDLVRDAVTEDALRGLRGTIAANQRMLREARTRFIEGRSGNGGSTGMALTTPLDVDGSLEVQGTSLSTKGTFFQQSGTGTGGRRLFFGDFDLQLDGETDSSTATLSGRMAWERMVSERTLLGYFIGGELAHSDIAGAFEGKQSRLGLTLGGYAVHEIGKNLYAEGFVTLGAGRNNLVLADDVLSLESDYTTRSVTLGGALTGVVERPGFEIWPELSFSYGKTWLGDIGFTGAAFGLVDNTLSLDAGSVTLANITLRTEFRLPVDGLPAAESLNLFTFAPRLLCEQIRTDDTRSDCGGGAEFGFTGRSADGLTLISGKVVADRVGDRTTSSIQLNLEHRF